MGWELKSESVFLLCALQCQSTHCNLPKVAAIYAIKHVFNIPQPHCVCVFLGSLALSHSHSLACLFGLISICACLCVCVCVNGPYRAAALVPPHRRIISPPQRHGRQEVGVYTGLLYPKKDAPAEELLSWSAVSRCCCCCCCRCRCGALPPQLPVRPSRCHQQQRRRQLSHPWLLLFSAKFFRVELGGQELWSGLAMQQQQLGLTAWETGRSCQHLVNRNHPALITHKTWRELSQENPLDTQFSRSLPRRKSVTY